MFTAFNKTSVESETGTVLCLNVNDWTVITRNTSSALHRKSLLLPNPRLHFTEQTKGLSLQWIFITCIYFCPVEIKAWALSALRSALSEDKKSNVHHPKPDMLPTHAHPADTQTWCGIDCDCCSLPDKTSNTFLDVATNPFHHFECSLTHSPTNKWLDWIVCECYTLNCQFIRYAV